MENRDWNTTVENQQATAAAFSQPLEKSTQAFGLESKSSFERAGLERNEKSVLSRREVDVIEHIKEGLKNPEIAKVLNLSTKTVENHVRNILLKLGVKNRTQAVVNALQRSIITF